MPGRSYRFICLPLFVLMLLASVATLSAQTTNDIGGINRQYWDKGDNGSSGAYVIQANDNMGNPVSILPDSDIFTFSTAQKASIDSAFDYWGDVLGLGAANAMSPVIRVVGQDINVLNANALSLWDSVTTNINPISRIVNSADPTRVDGIDGRMVFFNTSTFTTTPFTQYTGGNSLGAVALHELGHIFGIASGGAAPPAMANQLPPGFFLNTAYTDDIVAPNTSFSSFTGANATAVFGANVPLGEGNSHFVIPFSVMSRGFFFTANGDFKDFRNNIAFTPVELAVMRDIGYNITLSDHFGDTFYQDSNGVQQSVAAATPTKNFGVGTFIQADNLNLLFDNDISANGTYGTGIRINGGQEAVSNQNGQIIKARSTIGNLLTIDQGTSISANGMGGIGLLQSAGGNNVIVHRGTINANGTDGRGMVFDFGSDNLFNQVNSDDYGFGMVSRLDLSGTINTAGGNGAAIFIDDSAAFGTINVMDGADINGDVITHARLMNTITNTAYTRPEITFGFEADGNGAVTGTADNAFDFTFDNDIGGSTSFNATFAGGTTNLNGISAFNNADVLSGATLTTNGTFVSSTLDLMSGASTEVGMSGMLGATTFNLMSGATLTNNGGVMTNTFTTGAGSLIQGNGTITANNPITMNGTSAPGNSIGTQIYNSDLIFSASSLEEIEVQPSMNPVAGTDNDLYQVNGSVMFNGGTVDVQGLPPGGAYTMGATYTWLQTTGGIGVNTAPILTEDLLNFRVVPFFTFNTAGFMLANDAPYLDSAVNYNERTTAAYLDVAKLDLGNPQIQMLRDQLDLLPGTAAVRNALNQLSGEIYGTSAIYQIQSMNHLMDVLTNQVGHNHAPHLPCMNEIWYSGYASSGHVSNDGNASSTDYDSVGHTIGKSWCVGPKTVIGAFFNYEDQQVESSTVNSRVETEAQRIGLYLNDHRGRIHTTFIASTGWNNNDSTRNVRVNALSEQNTGEFNGWTTGFLYENGLTFGNDTLHAQPFGSLQYLHAQTEDFSETGGAVTSLRVDEIHTNSLRSKLGGRFKFFNFRKLLSLDVETAWVHEMGETAADYQVGLNNSAGNFNVRGADLGSDWINFSPSMNLMIGPFRSYLEYQAAYGEASIHSGQWGTELIW